VPENNKAKPSVVTLDIAGSMDSSITTSTKKSAADTIEKCESIEVCFTSFYRI